MAQLSGTDRPKISELHNYIKVEVSPKWKDLGIQLLNAEQAKKLDVIQTDHPGDSEKCCTAMFNYWLQVDTTASWDKLITALQCISHDVLADTIKKMTSGDCMRETEKRSNNEAKPSSSTTDAVLDKESGTVAIPINVELNILSTDQGIPSVSMNIPDLFKEPITITKAYTVLIRELTNILKFCDLPTLKIALFHQVHTPDGVKLEKSLEENIEGAKSVSDLLLALGRSQSCNWLDTRLIETLADVSKSSTAVEVINAYQKFLVSKKLSDVLSRKREHIEAKRDYVTAIRLKTKMDPTKITVGDFKNYQWTIEDVILDLGKGVLNIEHVNEGCLEITYVMPVHYSFNAYKMVLHNRHEFCTIDLIHVEIGDHPLIYDPWLSDLEKHSVKQILHTHHKVSSEICHILLDNISMDDIAQLFRTHKILIDDDVVSFAPSEHLRNKCLLECLWNLKLSVWPMICDILLNTKSMRHVGSQLMEVFKDKLSHTEHYKQTLASGKPIKIVSTLHGTRTIKLGFVDDSTLFNKSQAHYPKKVSLFICPFQHVKRIKPSEVEKEFQYVSGHILELLSHCHPKLLRNWCENLLASEKIHKTKSYSLFMLWLGHSKASEEHEIKLLPPYTVYKLRKLRTSSSILKMMSMFWSWSNHSILTSLANFSEIAAALLEDFDSRLYLNSSITKYPISSLLAPAMIPHNNNSFTVLTLKCNIKLQVTLQLVYDIQLMMIEKCEITEHALQLLAVQSRPLVLQWMISKYVVTVINVNVRRHQEYFATKGITEISIHPNIKHCIDGISKLLPIHEKGDVLCFAAETDNVAETKRLIQSGVFVDSINESGWTPLIQGSWDGCEKVVEVLLTAGADVNFGDESGWTPIFVASESGYDKVVEVLLTAGADVNVATIGGWTPIYVASWGGNDKVVEVLLTAGADVNVATKGGETPIYVASERGYDKIVEVLLTAGADVNLPNNRGETPVDAAIRRHHHKVVDVLLKSAVNINIDSKASDSGYSGSSSMSIHSGSTWSSSGLKLGSVSVGMTGETLIMEEPHVDIEDPSLPGKEFKSTVATSSDED